MKHNRLVLALAVLVLATLACGLFGSKGSDSDVRPPPQGEEAPGAESPATDRSSGEYDTEFPLPSEVENFMDLGDGAINYQTPMEMLDVVEFYRNEFANAGYVERDITTVINDDTFSIVWDGHPSGQAIVVQGVDLGNGTVNVNVRFEDI